MLDPILDETVNTLSSPPGGATRDHPGLAKHRRYQRLRQPDFCRVEWDGGSHTVSGTLLITTNRALWALTATVLTCCRRKVIFYNPQLGQTRFYWASGTILGQHNINIATWRTGRTEPGGLAISFIRIDEGVPDEVIARWKKLISSEKCKQYSFDDLARARRVRFHALCTSKE